MILELSNYSYAGRRQNIAQAHVRAGASIRSGHHTQQRLQRQMRPDVADHARQPAVAAVEPPPQHPRPAVQRHFARHRKAAPMQLLEITPGPQRIDHERHQQD